MNRHFIFLFILSISMTVYADDSEETDITAFSGIQVQSARSASMSLPNKLLIDDYNLFMNPARICDANGLYFEGWTGKQNVWGGSVFPIPLFDSVPIKAGIFIRRPISPVSPLFNCVKEPRYGTTVAFNDLADGLGVIDTSSEYFKSDTAFPGDKKPSSLFYEDDTNKGFGNFDACVGTTFNKVNIGLLGGYSRTQKSESDTLRSGSTRSLSYSVTEYRLGLGVQLINLNSFSGDFAYVMTLPSLNFKYSALTTSSYPDPDATQVDKSESLKLSSNKPTEMSILLRGIYSMEKTRIIGVLQFDKYDFPILASGKLCASPDPAVQTVLYNTSHRTISADFAFHRQTTDKITMIYSFGLTLIKENQSKKTDHAPNTTGDGSIWGTQSVNETRSTNIKILPVGIASEYKASETMTLRLGLRKYIWAPKKSSYTGHIGADSTKGHSNGQFASGDNFFASTGVSWIAYDKLILDFVIETSYFSLSRNNDDASLLAGASVKYQF